MTTNTARTGNNHLSGSAICPAAQKTGTLTLSFDEVEKTIPADAKRAHKGRYARLTD